MGRFFIFFLCLSFASRVWAADKSACLNNPVFQSVLKQFQFEDRQSKDDPWAATAIERLCGDEFGSNILSVLADLKSFPALNTLPDEFNFNIFGNSPFDFFSDRVKTVRLERGTGSHCSQGTLAYVANRTSKTIYMCEWLASQSRLTVASILVHESNHLDGPNDKPTDPGYDVTENVAHPHKRCKDGEFLYIDVCDDSYETGGSYAIQAEFYVKVSRTLAFPATLRKEARGMAVATLVSRFNQLPFELRSGVLLESTKGKVSFFDPDDNYMEDVIPMVKPGEIVAERVIPTVFNAAEGTVKSYVGEPLMDTPGGFAAFYRDKLTASQKEGLLDAYFGNFNACYLFTKSLYCQLQNESVVLKLPETMKPSHFGIFPLFGVDSVFLITEDGTYYWLPFKQEAKNWDVTQLETYDKFKGLRSVGLLVNNERNVAVEADGRLTVFKEIAGPHATVRGFETERYKKIVTTFRWSPKFWEL